MVNKFNADEILEILIDAELSTWLIGFKLKQKYPRMTFTTDELRMYMKEMERCGLVKSESPNRSCLLWCIK